MIAPALLAVGALLWLAAGLVAGLDAMSMLGIAILAAGAALAALARARALHAAGLGLAFAGMLLFLGPGLLHVRDAGPLAGHLFAVALALAAVATWLHPDAAEGPAASRADLRAGARGRAAPVRGERLARAAWSLAALAALVWLYDDRGRWVWQPGNALVLVASVWLAVRPRA